MADDGYYPQAVIALGTLRVITSWVITSGVLCQEHSDEEVWWVSQFHHSNHHQRLWPSWVQLVQEQKHP